MPLGAPGRVERAELRHQGLGSSLGADRCLCPGLPAFFFPKLLPILSAHLEGQNPSIPKRWSCLQATALKGSGQV